MNPFCVHAPYEPAGDQPKAIREIVQGLTADERYITLRGVTGSGKTYTMAKVIEAIQRPTLVISHNKTLSAQLYREFKEFFPDNAVEYFVSYYDYYQPEAYVPARDLYIEKEAEINDEIERMRLSATRSLFERRDVIIVATVSCIYGLATPEVYSSMTVKIEKGETVNLNKLKRRLIELQYEREGFELEGGVFCIHGETIDIYPAYAKEAYRIELDFDTVKQIRRVDPMTFKTLEELDAAVIYPAKQFVMPHDMVKQAIPRIREELEGRLAVLKAQGKVIEAERLKTRVEYDLDLLDEMGYCPGIENYSAPLSGRAPGERPSVLLDYFPKDFLTIIDESHVTLPQIGAMYAGDRSRKENLVEYGFRLPSALDNRPLRIDEFESLVKQVLYVSATPAQTELERSNRIVEQIIRPTGLVDPEIYVRPTEGQMDDIHSEIQKRIAQGERSLILTLTKRMAEELAEYLTGLGLRVRYIHSEVETIERVEILQQLRKGDYDVLIGINLLREGIDLPEVAFIAILDADKIGFLRSATSLIQIIGRAARNAAGTVVMYADRVSPAMQIAIDETARRRAIQLAYNREHNITPVTIKKEIHAILERHKEEADKEIVETISTYKAAHNLLEPKEKEKLIKKLEAEMLLKAKNLEFEAAAMLRDEIARLKG